MSAMTMSIPVHASVHFGAIEIGIAIELLQEATTTIGLEDVMEGVTPSVGDKYDSVYVIFINRKYLIFRVMCTS